MVFFFLGVDKFSVNEEIFHKILKFNNKNFRNNNEIFSESIDQFN